MKIDNRGLLFLLLVLAIAGLASSAIWWNPPANASQTGNRKIICYQDSMHPWVKSDQPGKCTICSMDLTPIYEGEKGFDVSDGTVVLSPNSIAVLNVQTEEVRCQTLVRTLRVAGTLEANETQKTIISAPAPCRILSMDVGYVGVEVEKGQTLLTLFSPELVLKRGYFRTSAISQGIKIADDSQKSPDAGFYSGSLVAPQSGIIVERNVYSGQYVPEGEKLFTIVDPSVLWFRFDVYERQLPWLEPGQPIEVTVDAVPGKTFPTVISFIDPTISGSTRTLKARAEIKNPVTSINGRNQRLLRFGMYAEGRVQIEVPEVLTVPRTAVLFPGGSAQVFVVKGDGAYERRQVELGRQNDDLWEVLKGLDEGERVVTAGNVLIDAQAQFNQGGRQEDTTCTEDRMPAVVPSPAVNAPASEDTQKPLKREQTRQEKLKLRAILKDEMWQQRSDAIAKANGQESEDMPPPSATDPSPVHQSNSDAQTPALNDSKESSGIQKPLTYNEMDKARMAIRDEMRKEKLNAIAKAEGKTVADVFPFTTSQHQALVAFIAEADGISQALTADDLARFNKAAERIPAALELLNKEIAVPHPWAGLVKKLTVLGAENPAKDIGEARGRFLPYSTAVVELAKRLKKEDKAFIGLKIYHCPMAPKPGLWIQSKGPLANPFFGAKMLTCGSEVVQ